MTEILQVVTDTDRRGGQVFATDLHRALEGRGRTVRTVALQGRRHSGGLDIPVLGVRRRGPATLRSLRREITNAEVVVGHGSATLVACAAAGAGTSTPFVYRQISDQLYWANTRRKQVRVRAYLRRADAVVALWPGAAHVLAHRFDMPSGRIHLIPNGVPADRFPVPSADERRAARAQLGLRSETPVVVCLNALVPEKGTDIAVRVVGQLEVHLLVAGDGPERASLQRLAEEVAPGKVQFLGSMLDPRQAYAAADVVMLCSRGGDSMPAVLIEAGLSELPVVATRVGGTDEIVAGGVTGETAEPEDVPGLIDALQKIFADPCVYGRAARERCMKNFEIGVVAAAWDQVLVPTGKWMRLRKWPSRL